MDLRTAVRPVLCTLILAAVTVLPRGAFGESARERSLQVVKDRYQSTSRQFQEQMVALADSCAQQGLLGPVEEIRLRSAPLAMQTLDVDALPDQIVPDPPLSLPESERAWRVRLRKLEVDYAAELYRLSRDCVKYQHASFAFELIREAGFHDPNHPYARGLLGYVRYGNEWTTPFAKTMRAKNYVDHPQFGWLPARDVSRYENGERFYNGIWISAEKEAAIRSDFNRAWEILTEHFQISTNHSLEAGVQIGRELEQFHQMFMREFAAFFNTPAQMQRLFDKGSASALNTERRYKIHYFRTREEYAAALRPRQPQIDITNGLYMPQDRIAYLYHDPDSPSNMSSIYHEVTHQLLGETTPQQYDVARQENFWLIEGFACYVETVRREGDGLRLGTPRDDRIYWARERVINEGFYIPMAQSTRLGMDRFRAIPTQLPQYYSQAAGMVYFFLQFEDGLYRDAFIDHLSQVYSPYSRTRSHVATLEELTGVSFAALDQQYRDYMQQLPAEPRRVVLDSSR